MDEYFGVEALPIGGPQRILFTQGKSALF